MKTLGNRLESCPETRNYMMKGNGILSMMRKQAHNLML